MLDGALEALGGRLGARGRGLGARGSRLGTRRRVLGTPCRIVLAPDDAARNEEPEPDEDGNAHAGRYGGQDEGVKGPRGELAWRARVVALARVPEGKKKT